MIKKKQILQVTFVTVSGAILEAIREWLSLLHNNMIPSTVAKILILFSFAETANNVPSLLKRIRGLALNWKR